MKYSKLKYAVDEVLKPLKQSTTITIAILSAHQCKKLHLYNYYIRHQEARRFFKLVLGFPYASL